MRHDDDEYEIDWQRWMLALIASAVMLVPLGMWGCPQYNVWQQGLAGEAELKRAEQNRRISVAQAQAKAEAAESLAKAEVIRAEGVAKANKIIGESLHNNEAYLRYLWIDGIHERKGDTIYVPTEAGLPILEANRLKQGK